MDDGAIRAAVQLEQTTRNWRTIVQSPSPTGEPAAPTPNRHFVTYEKRDMRLTIGRVMTRVMTPAEALNLAAWLVRHADPDGSKFLPLLAGTFVQEKP